MSASSFASLSGSALASASGSALASSSGSALASASFPILASASGSALASASALSSSACPLDELPQLSQIQLLNEYYILHAMYEQVKGEQLLAERTSLESSALVESQITALTEEVAYWRNLAEGDEFRKRQKPDQESSQESSQGSVTVLMAEMNAMLGNE